MFLGLGFVTKMLQAWIVVPAFALAYLVGAAAPARRRVADLLGAGAVLLASSMWWVALVSFWPGPKPYIGGSTDGSVLNLVIGYNGLGRILGRQAGRALVSGARNPGAGYWAGGGPGGRGGFGGSAGLTRLFGAQVGGQISWLLPLCLLILVSVAIAGVRQPGSGTPAPRAGWVLWGGWLLMVALVLSVAQGGFHPYHTTEMAPAVAAVTAAGVAAMWRRYRRLGGYSWLLFPAAVTLTAGWAWVLVSRDLSWHGWLRDAVAGVAVAAVVLLVAARVRVSRSARVRVSRSARVRVSRSARVRVSRSARVRVSRSARVRVSRSARVRVSRSARVRVSRSARVRVSRSARVRVFGNSLGNSQRRISNVLRAAGVLGVVALLLAPGVWSAATAFAASGSAMAQAGPRSASGPARFGPRRRGLPARFRGGMAGDLTADQRKILSYAQANASTAPITLAVDGGAMAAEPFLIHSDATVIGMGGFSGQDPVPTVATLAQWVQQGRLRFVLAGGWEMAGGREMADSREMAGGREMAGRRGRGGVSAQRAQWVQQHCTVVDPARYGGATRTGTLYDCQAR